jgi:hypothetical protein
MTPGSETDWDDVVEAGRIMDEAAMPDEQVVWVGNGIVITERPDAFVVYGEPQDPLSWESRI